MKKHHITIILYLKSRSYFSKVSRKSTVALTYLVRIKIIRLRKQRAFGNSEVSLNTLTRAVVWWGSVGWNVNECLFGINTDAEGQLGLRCKRPKWGCYLANMPTDRASHAGKYCESKEPGTEQFISWFILQIIFDLSDQTNTLCYITSQKNTLKHKHT